MVVIFFVSSFSRSTFTFDACASRSLGKLCKKNQYYDERCFTVKRIRNLAEHVEEKEKDEEAENLRRHRCCCCCYTLLITVNCACVKKKEKKRNRRWTNIIIEDEFRKRERAFGRYRSGSEKGGGPR